MYKDKMFDLMRIIISVSIALVLAVIIITLTSKEPLTALSSFLLGPVSNPARFGNVLEMAIPLTFTGLALSVLFKAKLFNLGAEGIFYFCGLFAAYLAVTTKMPSIIHPYFIIILCGILGGIIGAIPGFLKAKWNANELVTSLMFNYIWFGIGLYLLNNKFRDVSAYAIASPAFEGTAKLVRIIPGTRIHTGIILMAICSLLLYLFINKTKWGYEIRMMGINKWFANYSGMKSFFIILYAHAIAGLLAGIGGAAEVLGMYSKFQWTYLPGYGLDGALVSLLAKDNAAMVPFAALFLAYIRIGADLMSRNSDVPSEVIAIVQAIIILLISSKRLLHTYKERMLLREAKANG